MEHVFFTYLMKSAALTAAFTLLFHLLLRKESFHQMNRSILITSLILSYLLPLCSITIHRHKSDSVSEPAGYTYINNTHPEQESLSTAQTEIRTDTIAIADRTVPFSTIILFTYLAGLTAILIWKVVSITKVIRVIRRGSTVEQGPGYRIIRTLEPVTPFNWMQYIVLNEKDLDPADASVIEHEKAHVKCRHSLDMLITDILSLPQWFNPAVWILRNELSLVHEFEADATVLGLEFDRKQYQHMLLNRTVAGINLWNIANGLLNKKSLEHRIDMMKRKPSSRSKAWKAVTIPLAAVLFLILTASVVYDTNEQIIAPKPIKPISSLLAEAKGDDTIYVVPNNRMCMPSVGTDSMLHYIENYVQERINGNCMEGRVIVEFIVEKNGELSNVRVVNGQGLNEYTDNIAIGAVSSMPKWNPGLQDGEPVRVYYRLPVWFTSINTADDKTTFVIPSDLSVLTGISKYAPKGYLCGYVVTEPAGNISYGLFLVKNRKRYELVLKWSYKTETRRIDSDLANELLGSAEANLDNATDEKPVAGERGNDTGIKLVDFYDGNKVYVLMPDKAAEYRSEEIPDKIWLEQYRSFTNSQEQVASESKKEMSFEYEGFLFYIISNEKRTVELMQNPIQVRYPTLLELPKRVKHNGISYKVSVIGSSAFQGHDEITKVIIPNSISHIREDAFYNCHNLQEIIIPKSVKEIDSYSFMNCTSLMKVSLPKNIKAIKEGVFMDCGSIEAFSFPKRIKTIGKNAFYGCHSIKSLNLPKSLENIGESAFQLCTSIETIVIPDNVSTIGPRAFECADGMSIYRNGDAYSHSRLKNITIGSGIEVLEDGTFAHTSIDSVHIPAQIKAIGPRVFSTNYSLKKVRCDAKVPPKIEKGSSLNWIPYNTLWSFEYYDDIIFHSDMPRRTLYVPKGCIEAYRQAEGWKLFDNIIESN